jgi:hypothetical protein
MAKRSLIGHPKFDRLQMRLGLARYEAVGILETLWHMAGRFAPQGDIGKYDDEEIEAWIGWAGEPGALVTALIACRFIDRSDQHRLVVHDWHDHVDNTTKTALRRNGLATVSGEMGKSEPNSQPCCNTVETDLRSTSTVLTPPEPEPEPEPYSLPETEDHRQSSGLPESEGVRWYEEEGYENRRLAEVAIKVASTRIRSKEKPFPYRDITENDAAKVAAALDDCPTEELLELFWGAWYDFHADRIKAPYKVTGVARALRDWASRKAGVWATHKRLQGYQQERQTEHDRPPVWKPGVTS